MNYSIGSQYIGDNDIGSRSICFTLHFWCSGKSDTQGSTIYCWHITVIYHEENTLAPITW